MYARDPLLSDVLLYEMQPGLFLGGWAAAAHACRTEALGPYSLRGEFNKWQADAVRFRRGHQSRHAMEEALAQTINKMKDAIDQQVPVLVHCSAGSRPWLLRI